VYDATTAATVTAERRPGVRRCLHDQRQLGDLCGQERRHGKSISVTGIRFSGADAGNYTFNTTASAMADITPRPLTVSATGVNKVYDGTTRPR
jgi:hypothetical protein